MAGRPRTTIGTFGDISYSVLAGGKVRARVRHRDEDGRLRLVQATGPSRKAAERALKQRILTRGTYRTGYGEVTADTTFAKLVEVWLADLDLEGKIGPRTRALYEWNMTHLVLPAFGHYLLREISVRKVDQFIKTLATTRSYSSAKQARTVLSLALGLAVRYDALRDNPVRDIAKLRRPRSQAVSLTPDQVQLIRSLVSGWRRGPGVPGPPPDGQLEQIIEVMLGTSARIGEVLALRACDVDLEATPPTVRICGTIVSAAGQPTVRQPHPKSESSVRVVAVPGFTAHALRSRVERLTGEPEDHLLFYSRNGTPLTTNNVRRRLRAILGAAGITGVTPHSFRRTVATVLDRAGGADLAAEMLGHTSSQITKLHYIEPDDRVDPVTATILEALAPRRGKTGHGNGAGEDPVD